MEGGLESHLKRFVRSSAGEGVENQVYDEASFDEAMRAGILGRVDAVFLHTRPSWPQARAASDVAPTYAWVHDYAFVCPASIAWFRNTGESCHLPLGVHCVTNAYTKWCNARRPDRNLANWRAVSRTLRAVPHLSGVIVASDFVKRRLATGEVPEALVHVLPYFVPADEVPTAPNPAPGKRRALYVGRLSEVKGVDVLLRAAALIDCEVVIAGDGYNRPDLQALAEQLGIAGRTHFAGYVTDADQLAGMYDAADVVVIPSLWPEPFGIVGIEAMLRGRAVVASDVGGISEWLRDGEVGLLAQPGNPAALAEKMSDVLDDESLRARLAHAGRAHAATGYGWDPHWTRFTEILRSA